MAFGALMRKVVALLNEMKEKGIVRDYALGGATALVYYFEPVQTQYLDVFVVLDQPDGALCSLRSVYDFLTAKGGESRGEYVVVQNIPLQFLAPYNSLVEEAMKEAIYVPYEELQIRMFSFEYLMAIMVQTGRMKDKSRLEEISQLGLDYDKDLFLHILEKHGLASIWEKIKEGFTL